ncbi:hypothetical protein LG331_09980 [Vreelandella aquamarina]|uniref:hypothetical protein n=1 Tax=Vreelandella aquamarina TaxID=77097 RepID=UPI00384C84E0
MTSPNMRMIVSNLNDIATLAATSEALPVAYTQRSGRAYVWRSTSTSTQVITGEWESVQSVDAFTLYRHNLSPSATVRIEFLLDGETVYDSGNTAVAELITPPTLRVGIDPWGVTYNDEIPVPLTSIWLPATIADSFRITLIDPANPAGFLQVGRIIIGLSISLQYNPAYGVTMAWQENAQQVRTEGGSLRTITSGSQARLLSVSQDTLPEQDRVKLTTELVKRGKQADIFVSLYPEQGGVKELEHAFLSRRQNDYTTTHDYFGNWQTSFEFLEV